MGDIISKLLCTGPYFGRRGTFFADVAGDGRADAIVLNARHHHRAKRNLKGNLKLTHWSSKHSTLSTESLCSNENGHDHSPSVTSVVILTLTLAARLLAPHIDDKSNQNSEQCNQRRYQCESSDLSIG